MSRFKLWFEGLWLAALFFGGGLLLLSRFGFETTWILERWNGAAVASDALHVHFSHTRRTTATLATDVAMQSRRDQVVLTTACDRYEVNYTRNLGQIAINPPPIMRRCPGDHALLAVFGMANRYDLNDGRMTLTTPDGQTLVFRRRGPL